MGTIAQLKAPEQDRAIVAEPPLVAIPDVVAANRVLLGSAQTIGDRTLVELRQEARNEALEAAITYMVEAGEPVPFPPKEPSASRTDAEKDQATRAFSANDTFLVSGHQPELFHPGVWVKNFALRGMATNLNAIPLNLIVDNDIVKSTSLSYLPVSMPLPDVSGFPAKLATFPFDGPPSGAPAEEYAVRNEALFATFSKRLQCDWEHEPFLDEFWESVLAGRTRTRNLGERLVAARRHWERQWNCHNLELPVGRLCQTESFAWFAGHLLCHLEQFHSIYNQSVRQYRKRHGLRSQNHPVPELAREGDLWEAPFWAWQTGGQRRGRLFVRPEPNSLTLIVDGDEWCSLARSADAVVDVWDVLLSQGKKVRSRALTNTLFARVFLADLFVHGLGGGKYDDLTDNLIRQFYGLEPPQYLVLSATVLLPFPRYPSTPEQSRKLWHRLRELQHNPQRHLDGLDTIPEDAKRLAQAKEELIGTRGQTRRERRRRFFDLRKLTEQLSEYLEKQQEATRVELKKCREKMRANSLLRKRDYSFVLYPEEQLQEFLTQFL